MALCHTLLATAAAAAGRISRDRHRLPNQGFQESCSAQQHVSSYNGNVHESFETQKQKYKEMRREYTISSHLFTTSTPQQVAPSSGGRKDSG